MLGAVSLLGCPSKPSVVSVSLASSPGNLPIMLCWSTVTGASPPFTSETSPATFLWSTAFCLPESLLASRWLPLKWTPLSQSVPGIFACCQCLWMQAIAKDIQQATWLWMRVCALLDGNLNYERLPRMRVFHFDFLRSPSMRYVVQFCAILLPGYLFHGVMWSYWPSFEAFHKATQVWFLDTNHRRMWG